MVSLRDEWDFVQRYLDIERIRFGERLEVIADIRPDTLDTLIPTFSVQTLVENAVRHGAAPRVEPTTIRVSAARDGGRITVRVSDDGAGAGAVAGTSGTGLSRLRERLAALYGTRAQLDISTVPAAGFTAVLVVPVTPGE
jgi:LytS/YehU family sensor histidine kinase